MSEQNGELSNSIALLDAAQEQVRTAWRDETAKSYDTLNNNIKLCTQKVWALFCDANAGVEIVKKNYNSDEMDKELAQLGMQVEQV